MRVKCPDLIWNIFKSVLNFLHQLVAWPIALVVCTLFFIIILIPCILWKSIVVLSSKLRPGSKLMSCLPLSDMIFALDAVYRRCLGSNVTFLIVEGDMTLEVIRHNFIQKILNKEIEGTGGDYQYKRLRQRPVKFGMFYFWQQVDIHTNIQIREETNVFGYDGGIKERTVSDDEKELKIYLGALMTKPFPHENALWELILLRNYHGIVGGDHKSVIVFRMHHVLCDGYSFNHIVDEMIGEKSQYIVKKPSIRLDQKLRLLWTAPSWTMGLILDELFTSNWSTQRKKSGTGVLSITTIPLSVMKLIRQKLDCHFATIGMSLLGGAIRRFYLESHNVEELPDFIKILHSLPKPGHPLEKMCNHWRVGCFKIPLRTSSALKRLKEAESDLKFYIDNHYDLLAERYAQLANVMPSPVYNLFVSKNYGTSMAFTSLPGFHGSAKLWNHRVTNMYKICGLQYKESALTAAAYSHNGQVTYSTLANRDIIPNNESADRLTKEYLHAELQQLLKELNIDDLLV